MCDPVRMDKNPQQFVTFFAVLHLNFLCGGLPPPPSNQAVGWSECAPTWL